MVVIAQGILLRQRFEERGVAAGHVKETHQLAALSWIAWSDALGVAALADAGRDPGEQIQLGIVAAGLLPHLEETMHRIAGLGGAGGAVRYIFGELERPARQIPREAGIRYAARILEGRRREFANRGRLRQCGVSAGAGRVKRISGLGCALVLQRQVEVRAGAAVDVDNPL